MPLAKSLCRCVLIAAAASFGSATAAEPLVIPLWVNGAPGSEANRDKPEQPVAGHEAEGWIEEIHNPSLTVYLPPADKATGAAVIVAPGGGHRMLAADHEGHGVGQWLAEHGLAAFVLKYRLYRQSGSPYKREDAIADGERAVRLVRSRADEWHIHPDRIGFLGFSAGGDLTMAVAENGDAGDSGAADPIDHQSSRVDFQVPIYPGGVEQAIPKVTADTPPTLLICAVDDRDDIAAGLPNLYLALRKAGVPVELHIYNSGKHGFGMHPGTAAVNHWPDRLVDWMRDRKLLDK
jgi:acetyl esterase/lipase